MQAMQYINNLDAVASRHFAPGGIYHGVDGALRFGREMGCGLADSPDYQDVIQATYSFLVKHTLVMSTGVPISAKPFFDAVRDGISHVQQRRSESPHRI